MPRNDSIELDVMFLGVTPNAVLVSEDGERKVWLPLSQLTTDSDIEYLIEGEIFEVTLPEWLAYEKGLI